MDESTTTQEGAARYIVGECIGEGGIGSVHRAQDVRLNRWVAIKRLFASPGVSSEETAERIRREAHTLATLQHPNIVTVHDFGADAEGPFVVMELIEGETLERIIERAPLDTESFVSLATQSLAGLAAAHKAGLLHRDLKARNIMLAWPPGESSFQVKILDFGLAKFAPKPTVQTIDHGDSLLGSIHCMAPEQFRRMPLDARTDLYSLGCIFYFALTAQHPFDGESVAEIMTSHLEHSVHDLKPLRPDVPEAVCAWVMSLMNPDPVDRPREAFEALAGLKAATRRNTMPVHYPVTSSDTESFAAPSIARGSLVPLIVVVSALAVLGIAAGFFILRKAGTPPATASIGPKITPVVASPAISTPVLATPAAMATAAVAASAALPLPTVAAALASPPAVNPEPAVEDPTKNLASLPAGILDAKDLNGLRAQLSRPAVIQGLVTGVGQNKTGNVLYLNFSHRPHEAASLVFFLDGGQRKPAVPAPHAARGLEDLQPFSGKTIQVRGTISDYKGDMQIVVKSLDQLQVVP